MQTLFAPRSILLLGALASLGLSACGDDGDTAPVITRFDLSALTVTSGQRVTITYEVTGADTVEISAQPGGVVLPPSAELSGMVTSGALTANTTFVLTAKNAAGTTTNSKQVTIQGEIRMVSIGSFDANPTSVEFGATSILSWETMNATSVGIRTADGDTVLAPGTRLTGTLEVTPTPPATTYVLTAEGMGGPVTRSVQITVVGAPSITDFTATPSAIQVGESSLLAWSAQNVDGIEIRDDANNVLHQNTTATGDFEVTPAATTTYTLVASRAGFPDDTETVTVTVNPIQSAVITSFTASPSVLQNIGETSVLAWVVSNATGIELQAGELTIFTSSTALVSNLTVTPTRTTDYTLWARNNQGDASAVTSVTVNPSAPAITSFTATPNPVLVGGSTMLAWATLGAREIRLLRGAEELFSNSSDQVDAGSFEVTVTSTGPQVFTLEAENSNDVNRSSVTVVGQFAPVFDVFDVNPSVFYGASVTATVTWATSLATEVELYADGLAVVGFPTTSTAGVFSLPLTGTTEIEIVARNAVAETREVTLVASIFDKLEPNDTSSTAIALSGNGSGVRGSINPVGDVDYYSVTVSEGAYIQAWTNGGSPNVCTVDTTMRLYGPDGTTELAFDDDDGFNLCSDISGSRDSGAANLPAGTYFIAVQHYSASAVGEYYLFVQVLNPVCGDSVIDAISGEQCDDGNVTSGDGCNSACRIEVQPAGILAGPGTSGSFGGAVTGFPQRDYYRVEMAIEGFILAETFVPTAGRCDTLDGSPSANTFIRLFDENLVELGSNDSGGLNSCSRFDEFSGFNFVPVGTYYVSVEEAGQNELISSYVLELRTVAIGCGNGFLEAGEDCDDGNAIAGDGCSVLCELEGSPETEPNGTAGEATVVAVTPGSTTLVGAELPANDVDFFAVDVPEGHSLDVRVTVGSLTSCPANSPAAALALIDTDGVTVLGTATGPCPRAWPFSVPSTGSLPAGTYYLRVRTLSGAAFSLPYFLHVRLIAPGCGNGIFEAGEQCDDGNVVDNDGCSALCQGEIQSVYAGPAPAQTFAGDITPAQGRRFYQIDLTEESYVFADVFAPSAFTCVDATMTLSLFDDALAPLGTVSGPQIADVSCAQVNPDRHAWARQPAGTYYLMVEETGNNRPVPAYELVLQARPVDICGNTVTEAGEQCDDGNTIDADGCSALCEIEPDGVIVGPGVAPGVTQVFDLTVANPGDVQIIRVEMSSAGAFTAFTGVPAIGSCTAATAPNTHDTRIFLYDETLGTQIAVNDDFGGTACSRIQGVPLAPGVYFLVAASYFADLVIPNFQLEIQLAPAVCGNGTLDSGEQCDDGNLTPGDGCDGACAWEPIALFSGPGPNPTGVSVTYPASIPAAGASQVFDIEVTAEAYFSAATGVPAIGSCVASGGSNDTEIELFDDQGASVAVNDQFNSTNCSGFSALRLPPGTYQLDVHAWSATAVIPSLAVFMQLKPADVCGNAVTEVGVGEACDDGNTTDGDGCSSTCQMEAADISVVATPTLAIPDSTPAGVVTTLVVPATPVCAIGGISVSMDITHTWRGDLIVDLLSPAGTTVRLHNRTGSSADDIVGTYGLDLTPAQPLSGFSGQDPAGTWTLTVSDNAGGDTGTLNGWGLNINCQ